MMQRIAIIPRSLLHPGVIRCLKRLGSTSSAAARTSAATKESPKDEPKNVERRFIKMDKTQVRPLYLDAQATTPVDPRVLDAMLPYLTQQYGNPHSRNHYYGWESEEAVERAREQVASLIGADPKEIIFTSGATESNNMALKGVARFYGEKRNHIITTQTEHKCVLDSCRALEGEGYRITYLPVQTNGILNLKDLEQAITPQTALVSVMTVNNEIGVRQPITEIGAICKAKKILFHTDAAQAIGKIPIDVRKENINLMSISGHKIYGPKGIGALYVGRKPRVRLTPIQSGGGQERGLRSGTVPAPLAVGLGAACSIAQVEMAADKKWIDLLSERLLKKITTGLTHVIRNGDPKFTYPGCLNLSFAYVEGESLLMALKDIALSSGSACTSASLEPSYVLRAIGTDDDLAHSSIRFPFPYLESILVRTRLPQIHDPRVLDAMLPYLTNKWGNPHSNAHYLGWESEAGVEEAREKIAKLINAKPEEIVFTSGATESNNLALKGLLRGYRKIKSNKNHLITVKTEHKCILESAKLLESEGCKVDYLGVQQSGLIDHKELENLFTPQTALVSVMTINNEIGVHQKIPEIGALCEKKNVIFHTDAAQALGKVPIDVRKDKIQLMSMSAHKMYGPKGIGALFISNDIPIQLAPIINGGGQEFGFRSGTVPTPLAVGFGAACEVASYEMKRDKEWVTMLANRFRSKLKEKLTHVHRNGSDDCSYPGCFNLSFEFIEGEALMMGMRDVCVSTGSACSSASLDPSYVLIALGLSRQRANSAIRFGIGRFTTIEEVDYVAEKCIANVTRLREMSPLWEMVQEGIDLKTIIWAQH